MRNGRAQSRSTGFFVTAALLSGLLVVLSQLPFLAGPRAAARGLVAPLESAATAIESGAGSVGSVVGDIASLRGENRRLAEENARLRAQVAQLQADGAENDSLRRALAFERSFGHRMLAGSVIARGPDAFARTLTIDRGSAEGVRPGMVVVTGAGLVGRVREVAPHSAAVQTVADPLLRVNAYLVKSNLEGTVSGASGPLQMEVRPRAGAVAAIGEWALTSGIGNGYPRGIPIGQVTKFVRRDAATSHLAELAWANDLSQLTSVLVVTDFLPQ
jgi:rod shape-determining protein MreC